MEKGTGHAKMQTSKNTVIKSIWHWPEERLGLSEQNRKSRNTSRSV